ncbi:MAG: hypothetical protein ACOCVG_01790, partial [Verrucomicrobiota bacterium]
MDEEQQSRFGRSDNIAQIIFRIKVLLSRYWWVLVVAIVIGAGLKVFMESTKEPNFTSRAQLILTGGINLTDGGTYREEQADFFGTQTQLIKSDRI